MPAPKAKGVSGKRTPKVKINLYRNISVTFVVFTLMLLSVVFLFFYRQAVIIVTSGQSNVNLSFNMAVKNSPTPAEVAKSDTVSGRLVSGEKSGAGVFEVKSTKTVDSSLLGQVKIINDSDRNQPLAKTTQLQAGNGVVVRTNDFVIVPARGSIMVAVYPKDPASFSDILPGRLEIIKLNDNLRSKIYAQAAETLTNKPREVKFLADSDINRAKDELSQKLSQALRQDLKLGGSQKMATQIVSWQTDQKVGAETDTFNLTLKIQGQVLQTDESQLANLIRKKIDNLNLTGMKVDGVEVANVDFMVINEDLNGGVLAKVSYTLQTSLAEDNQLFSKDKFAGKTIEETKQYLGQNDLVKGVEVSVSPYWSKSLPSDPKRIKIIIQ